MNHFLDITQLSVDEINRLISQAIKFKAAPCSIQLPRQSVALMFYENSTRTRISFELAAKQLCMKVVQVDTSRSSENKGETVEDTIRNLVAMGIQKFVIRHSQEGIQADLAQRLSKLPINIINAGDGKHAHPSQAMIDMMTIMKYKPNLSGLKIAVVGNLRHSRVANSFTAICEKMGVGELVFVSPGVWAPETTSYGRWTDDVSEGLKDADVVMGLRVQKERLGVGDTIDLDQYRQDYRIDKERMCLAKSDAIIMHPGPVNRGIEMTSDIVDGPQSKIFEQVTNGVYIRMAVLNEMT